MIIKPVLMSIRLVESLRAPQRVARQRDFARRALRVCADCCGAPADGWEQDASSVPLPNQGFHWSISHKPLMVAAAIADRRVGIDIEQIKPRGHEGLWERVASDQEWSLCGGRGWEMFFRLWTAKEATLKANGKGIGGLSDCRIVEVSDDRHIKLHYADEDWRIEQYRHDDHIVSVTMSGESIEWQVAKP